MDSSGLREDYFMDFVHDLKEEHRKKKKEKKRSRSKSPKGRDRSRSRSRRHSRSRSPKKKSKKDKRDKSKDRDDEESRKDKKKNKKDKVIITILQGGSYTFESGLAPEESRWAGKHHVLHDDAFRSTATCRGSSHFFIHFSSGVLVGRKALCPT